METKTGLTVEVNRKFSVPVDAVYNAWISPDALKQWCKPMGNRLIEVDNDVKEGGVINYTAENDNGEYKLLINGNYEEVKENERLVYSWNWNFPNHSIEDSLFRVTVNFSKQDEETSSVEVRQENLKDEEAIVIHEKGWELSLDNLEQYLSEHAKQ